MKRIILSLLFNVCVICPAFCVLSVQSACLQLGTDDCGDVECSLPKCIAHEGVSSVSPSCLINAACKCEQKCTYTCDEGYYGGGSSLLGCTVCPEHATCPGASVVNGTATFTCDAGYKINALGNGCEPTAQCPDGQYLHTYNGVTACATCPANGTCANDILTCNAGYYKYTGQQSQYSAYFCCPNNATCNDTGEFQYCNDGYYGNETNGCMSCPPAATCTGGALTSCSAGYVCNADDGVVECYNCAVGDSCSNCKFNGCQDGYFDYEKPGETGREGHCILCPVNGVCTGGVFNGCNSEYYGDVNDGCNACPTNATCDGGETFKCNANYFKYTNETETGCTKCPTLDGRPGTSVAGANTDRSKCSVSVTSSSTLNDGVGTYYFAEETCYATDINK